MAVSENHSKRWSEEKISSAVLILLLMAASVVFVLFFAVDYDMPWDENTEFINPLYTDTLINFMFIIAGAACVAVTASLAWFFRCGGHIINVNKGIPARKIALGVTLLLLLSLTVSYVTASDTSLIINGKLYGDNTWLYIADMLIHTSEVLLVAASAAVIYGMSGINRKIQKY